MKQDRDYTIEDIIILSPLISYLICLYYIFKGIYKLTKLMLKGYNVTIKDYAKLITETFKAFYFNWVYVLIFNIINVVIGIFILVAPINVIIEVFTFSIVIIFFILYSLVLYYSWSKAIESFKR